MAQSNMTRTVGLALEGGGYRGMYTAGVRDCLASKKLYPLVTTV